MAKDRFSEQATLYASYRPSYPPELISYILQFVKHKDCAWDCATGNGQAAVLLADHFDKVYATDHSEKQLALAIPKKNISYSVSSAEHTPFPDHIFDLITVAQAYHWLKAESFAREVKRVAKKDGIIAIWGYNIPFCDFPVVNECIEYFYKAIVGKYWDPERRFIDEEYKTVHFPYHELSGRRFEFPVEWHLMQLAGYLQSWSSVVNFQRMHNYNLVDEYLPQLVKSWPDTEEKLLFRFPIFLRLGRV
jgi:ubiquinone/menaquinone biosynthesis C-methylase UbiE